MDVDKRYWVIDVEGNGSTPPEIVELAMVEVRSNGLTGETRHWLLRPNQPITGMATRIHGISNNDVLYAPSISDIADDLLLHLEELAIVGHNVHVDLDALTRALPEWRPVEAIDTLKLAKRLRPGLPSYGLEKLGSALGLSAKAGEISGARHHSALYDATLAGLIFVFLTGELSPGVQAEVIRSSDILYTPQGDMF